MMIDEYLMDKSQEGMLLPQKSKRKSERLFCIEKKSGILKHY